MRPDTDLERFVDAQAGVFDEALSELKAGRKTTHWMWFVFPQLRGLGHSPTARYYGIGSADEARSFLRHPVLGPRLRQCVEAVLAIEGRSLHAIFGSPDDLKFRSSMTMFAAIAPEDTLFQRALDQYCGGVGDPATVERLEAARAR